MRGVALDGLSFRLTPRVVRRLCVAAQRNPELPGGGVVGQGMEGVPQAVTMEASFPISPGSGVSIPISVLAASGAIAHLFINSALLSLYRH